MVVASPAMRSTAAHLRPSSLSAIPRSLLSTAFLSKLHVCSADEQFLDAINELCKRRKLKQAITSLDQMNHKGVRKKYPIYARILQSCVDMRASEEGKLIRAHMLKSNFPSCLFLNNRLIDLFSKSGCLIDARQLFDEMLERDLFSWNTLISGYLIQGFLSEARRLFDEMPERNSVSWAVILGGYVRLGHGFEALNLFRQMNQSSNQEQDPIVYCEVLRASAISGVLEHGTQLHCSIIKLALSAEELVRNTVLDVYAKCGDMTAACQLFEEMLEPDEVSFNSLIAGFARNDLGEEALSLYLQFLRNGLNVSQFTFAGALSGCASISSLRGGKQIHAHVIQTGFESNVFVGNAVMDMYAKSGDLEGAKEIFFHMPKRDNISWNGMITGYSQEGFPEAAIDFFKNMLKSGVSPTDFTYSSILSSCASISDQQLGLQIHCKSIKSGCESHAFVSNALIDMYAKCGFLESARIIFSCKSNVNTVSWTAMISGYVQNGFCEEALRLFSQMRRSCFRPDHATISSILKACANLTAMNYGKQLQNLITKSGFGSNIFTGSALVCMYAKCGCMEEAVDLFSDMPIRNSISWNAVIGGYAQSGEAEKSLGFFYKMLEEGTEPDHVTFISLLHACSHGGLVEEGFKIFRSMAEDFGITPQADHYACIVDLLGRCGKLEEAMKFIKSMPFEPDSVVWLALLGHCRIYKNVELAELAAGEVIEVEPENAAPYVLLSNVYSASGLWDEVSRVRKMMNERGVKKVTGCSWIESDQAVHVFVSNDTIHPRLEEIYQKLEELGAKMKKMGYVPDKNFVLQYLEEDQKEPSLSYHSEKLAVAFGIISVTPPLPIRVMKNLRVCGDCHSAMKLISEISGREIILRDSNRFHRFINGVCSCRDYW